MTMILGEKELAGRTDSERPVGTSSCFGDQQQQQKSTGVFMMCLTRGIA
jgi:hypothetical protein